MRVLKLALGFALIPAFIVNGETCDEWIGTCVHHKPVFLDGSTDCRGRCTFDLCCRSETCGQDWDGECDANPIYRGDSTDCSGTCDERTCCRGETCGEYTMREPCEDPLPVPLSGDGGCAGLCVAGSCCRSETCEDWHDGGGLCPTSSSQSVDRECGGTCDDTLCCRPEVCGDWQRWNDCDPDSLFTAIPKPDSTDCGGRCDEGICCRPETCGDWDGECDDPTPVRKGNGEYCRGTCDEVCCEEEPPTPPPSPVCPNGDDDCGEPHMQGLRGQRIDWSGVDGGWYSLIKDDNAGLQINVRLTAPLPDEFPDRQLMTGLTVMSEGHSFTIEVENPYTIDTNGCSQNVSPCLANGGLRAFVDGQQLDELLRFSRQVLVADGAISVSASNLPVECRQFGGDKIWARMYQEMMVEDRRRLIGGETLEDWILRYDHMAAPGWCAKYIAENDLADLQSTHAIFKIDTPTVTVRLNAGVNYQGDGELNWDGRVLPDLEFWQMDVGMDGLDIENPVLSGLLGETAHPVHDENGKAVMEGFEAFRGTVEDYRVSGAVGVHFSLLDKAEEGHE